MADTKKDSTPETMRAITVQQPYAWAMCHGKLTENRTRRSPFQRDEVVAIHAGVGGDQGRGWLNPVLGSTDPAINPLVQISAEEARVLARLARGVKLIQRRCWCEEIRDYVLYYGWDIHPDYPNENDRTVTLLLGRQAVRLVTCAGGRTWVTLPGGKTKVARS